MIRPKTIIYIFLSLILAACWDSYVNKKEIPKVGPTKETNPMQIDSSQWEQPIPKDKKPKGNKALDTLKPRIA